MLPDFGKDAWLVRIAGHRVLLGIGLVIFAAALGYFGGLTPGKAHPLKGVTGLLVGVAIALFAIVYATISVRRRRRS